MLEAIRAGPQLTSAIVSSRPVRTAHVSLEWLSSTVDVGIDGFAHELERSLSEPNVHLRAFKTNVYGTCSELIVYLRKLRDSLRHLEILEVTLYGNSSSGDGIRSGALDTVRDILGVAGSSPLTSVFWLFLPYDQLTDVDVADLDSDDPTIFHGIDFSGGRLTDIAYIPASSSLSYIYSREENGPWKRIRNRYPTRSSIDA